MRNGGGQANNALVRASNRATLWIVGTGFLSLHATLFTLTMVGLVLWNIYDTPNHLWVDEVVVRWGIVLAIHAIAVAAGWTAWRLMRAEQQAIDAARTPWSSAAIAATPRVSPGAWRSPPLEAAPYRAEPPRATGAAKRALVTYSTWTTTLAQRTVTAVSTTASKLTSDRRGPAIVPGQPAQDVAASWPEGPMHGRIEMQEFVARFGSVSNVQMDNVSLPAEPLAAPHSNDNSSPPLISKEAGQTWVEAATGAWFTPRAIDPETDQPATNDQHPGDRPAPQP